MSEKVIQFPGAKPVRDEQTITGPAICLECRHVFTAVVPAGLLYFECPECHLIRSVFGIGPEPHADKVWLCGCGCYNFLVTQKGICCCRCGFYQMFPEV